MSKVYAGMTNDMCDKNYFGRKFSKNIFSVYFVHIFVDFDIFFNQTQNFGVSIFIPLLY